MVHDHDSSEWGVKYAELRPDQFSFSMIYSYTKSKFFCKKMNAKGNIKIYKTSANPNLNFYTLLSKFMNPFFTV